MFSCFPAMQSYCWIQFRASGAIACSAVPVLPEPMRKQECRPCVCTYDCAALKAAVLKVIGECSFSPFPPPKDLTLSFLCGSQVGGATAACTVAMADRAAAAAGVVGGGPVTGCWGARAVWGRTQRWAQRWAGLEGGGRGRGLNIIAGRSSGKTSGGCPRLKGAE